MRTLPKQGIRGQAGCFPNNLRAGYFAPKARDVDLMEWTHSGLTGELSSVVVRGGTCMKITTIGLDIAKQVFQIHAADAEGRVVLRKRLRRNQLAAFLGIRGQTGRFPNNLRAISFAPKLRPEGAPTSSSPLFPYPYPSTTRTSHKPFSKKLVPHPPILRCVCK
jgi:hypothetical protein